MKEDNNREVSYESIKNLDQANWYLEMLKLPIRVGIDKDRKFYVRFIKTELYLKFKKIWMSGDRKDR